MAHKGFPGHAGTTLALPVLEDEVVRRAQRGDEAAFARIVGEYQVPVFNYVLRMVGDRELAEDLTQEVFLRIHQNLERFSFRAKFTTWLFQVAKNRVLDEVRSRDRRPRATAELEEDGLYVLDPPVERTATIDAIWAAIEELPVELRTALLLRDVSGFAYDEIAEIVDATLATVKWRIFHARERVARDVAAKGLIPERTGRGRLSGLAEAV